MASIVPSSCLFVALAIILKLASSGGRLWTLWQCSLMDEIGGELRFAPVRSLTPWCSAILFARLQVVCPI